jgi:hypothetical protein
METTPGSRTVHQQEAQEEHASKQAETTMNIFYGGLQNRVDHALQMIANLWILGLFITPDFEKSDLWTHGLLPIDLVLRTNTGIQWASRKSSVDHLCHAIILDCCTKMQAYAEMASRFELQEAAIGKHSLPPNMFEPANMISLNINRKLNNAVHSWTLGDYVQIPHTYDFMAASRKNQNRPSPPERTQHRNTPDHNRNTPVQIRNTPDQTRRRPDKQNNDSKKQKPNPGPRKGLIKFNRSGKLPLLAIVDKHHIKDQT